jgi:5-methylcytosine-specific restriction endonuclease McrA
MTSVTSGRVGRWAGRAKGERRESLIRFLVQRDGDRCFYCGIDFNADPDAYTLDHRMPRSLGGRPNRANMVLACTACNHKKGDGTEEELRSRRWFRIRVRTVQRHRILAAGLRSSGQGFLHPATFVAVDHYHHMCPLCGTVERIGSDAMADKPCSVEAREEAARRWKLVAPKRKSRPKVAHPRVARHRAKPSEGDQ